MIVVDASLATKWFLAETESDDALRFLHASDVILGGPDLLLTEVSVAIVRRANMNAAFMPYAATALKDWLRVWPKIQAHRMTADRVERATRLAIGLGHPLPDCIYLALAMELGRELATCDVKFRDRAAATYPAIRLLSDYTGTTSPAS